MVENLVYNFNIKPRFTEPSRILECLLAGLRLLRLPVIARRSLVYVSKSSFPSIRPMTYLMATSFPFHPFNFLSKRLTSFHLYHIFSFELFLRQYRINGPPLSLSALVSNLQSQKAYKNRSFY